jgi:hypothetical protein
MTYAELEPGDMLYAGYAAWMVIDITYADVLTITWMTLWSRTVERKYQVHAYITAANRNVQYTIFREGTMIST